MIHAYDKIYLDDAMRNLGEAMDYAVNACHLDMDTFMELFIAEGLATQFESGVPKLVAGMSGTELVWEIMQQCEGYEELPEARIDYEYSQEYWCGWILAYYQWYTGKTFKYICDNLSLKSMEQLYSTLHEASEEKCVEVFNYRIEKNKPSTQLQMLRRIAGYSQRMLAEKSGVNLRNIQQYEQRVKDINKAAGITLIALSKTLGCRVEDLLE